MKKKIYVIEDDDNIRDIIDIALSNNGYDVVTFDNAIDALKQLEHNTIDLAIFDLMLSKMSGMDAIKEIRKTNQELPVLIVSAKDMEIDIVHGFEVGADDYMTKPFGILELQARVKSLLKRCHHDNHQIKKGCLSIDLDKRLVFKNQQKIQLTNKEYKLLLYLVENSERVVEREELLNRIWGYDFIGETRVLDIHIRSLRHKIDDEDNTCIETTRGVGYRFNAVS